MSFAALFRPVPSWLQTALTPEPCPQIHVKVAGIGRCHSNLATNRYEPCEGEVMPVPVPVPFPFPLNPGDTVGIVGEVAVGGTGRGETGHWTPAVVATATVTDCGLDAGAAAVVPVYWITLSPLVPCDPTTDLPCPLCAAFYERGGDPPAPSCGGKCAPNWRLSLPVLAEGQAVKL